MDKPRRTRLIGGPQDGVIGELEGPPPPTLSFGENGGFTYTLVSDPRRRDKVLQYRYDPVHSPAHQLVVQADRDAIREVAEKEGISTVEVLARAREKRAAAARAGNVKPADALFAEADRLGVTPEALLEQGFDMSTLFPDGADFWGTLLPFMTVDSYRTLFAPDAFRDGGVDSDTYALLWMHDPWTVAGQFNAEVRDTGIWIAGAYDDTPEGAAARARGKSGSARGLSIGFERYADEDNEDGTTTITKARMVEGSQITSRMESVPGAGLAGVRGRGAPVEPAPTSPTADELRALRARLLLAGG